MARSLGKGGRSPAETLAPAGQVVEEVLVEAVEGACNQRLPALNVIVVEGRENGGAAIIIDSHFGRAMFLDDIEKSDGEGRFDGPVSGLGGRRCHVKKCASQPQYHMPSRCQWMRGGRKDGTGAVSA